MEYTAKDLKQPAWRAMRAAVPSAILVTLVYYLLAIVLPDVISYLTPTVTVDNLIYDRGTWVWVGLFLTVLLTLFQMVLEFGYDCWALDTARERQSGYGRLLDGFGMVGRVLLMKIQVLLRSVGWSCLFILLYAIAVLILSAVLEDILLPAALVLMVPLSMLLYVAVMVVMLRYELSPFLLCDYPDDGAGAAVRRSVEMTQGHLWQFVKLYLSFWPWYLAQFLIGLVVCLLALLPQAQVLMGLLTAGSYDIAVSQIQLALDGTLSTFLSLALSIPLFLFFFPYRRIAVANFYRALSQEPVRPSFSGESF